MGILATIIAGIPFVVGLMLIIEGYEKCNAYKPVCAANDDGNRYIITGIFCLVVCLAFVLACFLT